VLGIGLALLEAVTLDGLLLALVLQAGGGDEALDLGRLEVGLLVALRVRGGS
jgi:hypothetical protein